MTLNNKREYWIDAIRTFACLCVVISHSPSPRVEEGLICLPFMNIMSVGGASILFFMISGALVFYKEQRFLPFIKKRLARVVLPMFIWTVAIMLFHRVEGRQPWDSFWYDFLLIPFAPQFFIFWFIYVIFGIYLLTPAISTWLAHTTRREVEYVLVIWGVVMVLPYFEESIVRPMLETSGSYFYYFNGYLGFALLGYYLRKYFLSDKSFDWKIMVAPLVILFFIFLLYLSNVLGHKVFHNRMTLHMVILASSYFIFWKKIHLSSRMKNIVFYFAKYTFGIYLVHYPIIRSFLWPLVEPLELSLPIFIPFVSILAIVLSFCLIWIIQRFVPGSKYIVGV